MLRCLAILFALAPFASAFQALIPEAPVTIVPRTKPTLERGSDSILRADSSLVLISAHVTTAAGESVTNLGKENFKLSEDSVEQSIAHFTRDDAAVSVGMVVDASGSMGKKMQTVSEAAAAFFRTANQEDEFFLVQFNDRAKLAVPFTRDSGELYSRIAHLKSEGRTSLLDAVHLSLMLMKKARNFRKALVIVSDGGDNWSRHKVREIKNALIESDVQVYAMGIFDPEDSGKLTPEEKNGPRLLDELTEQSGGRHYRIGNLNDLPAASAAIGNELRNEYLLGYYSLNPSRDGKYRQVKLSLVAPALPPGLHTYYRRGYYAPSE